MPISSVISHGNAFFPFAPHHRSQYTFAIPFEPTWYGSFLLLSILSLQFFLTHRYRHSHTSSVRSVYLFHIHSDHYNAEIVLHAVRFLVSVMEQSSLRPSRKHSATNTAQLTISVQVLFHGLNISFRLMRQTNVLRKCIELESNRRWWTMSKGAEKTVSRHGLGKIQYSTHENNNRRSKKKPSRLKCRWMTAKKNPQNMAEPSNVCNCVCMVSWWRGAPPRTTTISRENINNKKPDSQSVSYTFSLGPKNDECFFLQMNGVNK